MTDITAPARSSISADRIASSPFLLALIAVTITFVADGARGFQMLSIMGIDNDSQMRLVQVRDLLGGQSWFDVHQYRLGAPEGSSMHWSRLIDFPIAAIIWVATAITGSQAWGEDVALVLWPALTFVAVLYLLLRAARRYGGNATMVPAVVVGAITLYIIGIFSPGSIDHHNVQLGLTLGILTFLLESLDRPAMAYLAGAAAALTLAIGMETVPYVGFAGLLVAGWYLLRGEQAARATVNFGIGFAAAALAALVVTAPPSLWLVAQCDAYSVAQFAVAVGAGAGIALAASLGSLRATLARRAAVLVALGTALTALVLVAFPQCLAPPYADLDPRLRDYWMRSISEAQPIWSVVRSMPVAAANYYPPVIVALAWMAWSFIRKGFRTEDAFVAAFLVPAALVSFYQLRGANFALAFSVLPLAAMIADQRRRLEATPSIVTNLRAIGAWLVSINMVWMLAAGFIIDSVSPGQSEREQTAISGDDACLRAADFAQLATEPARRVVSITNLGASILRYTQHHSFAGPYHRNIEGNLVALSMLSAKPEAAKALAAANDIDLVVVCRGNPESGNYAEGSLQAELNSRRPPDWLVLVPETAGGDLEAYRVTGK